MRKCFMLVGLGLYSSLNLASNLGNYGELFPINEEDIRTVIMRRLHQMEATGEMARHQKIVQERIKAKILRPMPLDLKTTKSPKTFFVDPSIQVARDIVTPDGVLVAKKGTKINPFERVKLNKTLIFFNGDDARQVGWVLKHYRDYQYVKFILTGGNIADAAEHFGRIYFDVGGALKNKLQLKHVPSVVSQEGFLWKIKEIGEGDA